MKSQILVTLDGSAFAERILPHALTLARATGNELTLLCHIRDPARVGPFGSSALPEDFQSEIEAEIGAEIKEVSTHTYDYMAAMASRLQPTEIGIHTVVLPAHDPAEGVADYIAEHEDVCALALATHCRQGPGRLLLGSTAEHLLQSTDLPILLDRPCQPGATDGAVFTESKPYHDILIPLIAPHQPDAAVTTTLGLAQATAARIIIVAATPQDREHPEALEWLGHYLATTERRLEAAGVPVTIETGDGHPLDVVLRNLAGYNADLIVMPVPGPAEWEESPGAVMAMETVRVVHGPVLLVRPAPMPGARVPLVQARGAELETRQSEARTPAALAR